MLRGPVWAVPLPATIDMTPEAIKNLASIRPSFIVKDLQASIAYCRERLGFQLDFQGRDDGPFWAGVSRDGIGIMPKAVGSDVPLLPPRRVGWSLSLDSA